MSFYQSPYYPRACVGCGAHTDYDIYVKSAYNLPTPHCLLCSMDLEQAARDKLTIITPRLQD